MQKEKIEICLPFCGFYETWAGEKIEEWLFGYWRDRNVKDQNKWEYYQLTEKQKDKWEKFSDSNKYYQLRADYKKSFCEQYARDFFKELHNESGVLLEFEDRDVVLDSPRFYNFTTDRIFVKVDKAGLLELYKKINMVKFAEKVKEKFTDRPGFSSYYPNYISGEWLDVDNYDHNQWLTVIETYIDEDTEEGRELLENIVNEIYI